MNKEGITLTKKDGAIVMRPGEPPEIYAPLGPGDELDDIRFTLAFLLYSVEKEDWIEEFSSFVDTIREDNDKLDAESRRSKFKVIEGEKDVQEE